MARRVPMVLSGHVTSRPVQSSHAPSGLVGRVVSRLGTPCLVASWQVSLVSSCHVRSRQVGSYWSSPVMSGRVLARPVSLVLFLLHNHDPRGHDERGEVKHQQQPHDDEHHVVSAGSHSAVLHNCRAVYVISWQSPLQCRRGVPRRGVCR